MSRTSVLVLFVLAVAALGGGLRSCTRQFTAIKEAKELWETWDTFVAPRVAYPFGDSSLCTDKKYPFCVLSNQGTNSFVDGNLSSYEFSCVECRSNCDCPIGKYCSATNGINVDDFGRCVSYSKVVGKKCDPSYTESQTAFNDLTGNEAKARDYVANPEKYCAVVRTVKQINNEVGNDDVIVSLNSSHIYVAFQGACVLGTCRECNSLLTYKSFDDNANYYIGYYPFFGSDMARCKPSSRAYAPWYSKFTSGSSSDTSAHISEYITKPRYCHNFKYHYLDQDDVDEMYGSP